LTASLNKALIVLAVSEFERPSRIASNQNKLPQSLPFAQSDTRCSALAPEEVLSRQFV